MNAAELLTDLAGLGIKLAAHGDRLRYWPRSAVTPALVDRLKAHKAELLALLRHESEGDECQNATGGYDKRPTVDWTEQIDPDGRRSSVRSACCEDEWEAAIDPPATCSKCGMLELWQTLAGNWRCQRCDPPIVGQRVREQVARLRNRAHWVAPDAGQGAPTTQNTSGRPMR